LALSEKTLEELTVKRSPSALAVLALAACTLVLTACPPRESIAAINRDPAGMRGAKISVGGRVVESIGALGFGFFKIDRWIGPALVYSQNFGTPSNGSKVGVVGALICRASTSWGANFGMILKETERRH